MLAMFLPMTPLYLLKTFSNLHSSKESSLEDIIIGKVSSVPRKHTYNHLARASTPIQVLAY